MFLFCSDVDLTDIDADPRACWPGSDMVQPVANSVVPFLLASAGTLPAERWSLWHIPPAERPAAPSDDSVQTGRTGS